MLRSPVLLGIVVLSVFSGPSGADRAMPKLADRKLCADEECSRKDRDKGRGVGAWAAVCFEVAVIPFSLPRSYLHGCGPSGLRGPRLPLLDHIQGPSGVCLLQVEGPWAAFLGRQCESSESDNGKGVGLGWV